MWSEAEHAMKPLGQFRRVCASQYVDGELYTLDVDQQRSMASHNHYFAALTAAWKNLNEAQMEEWPTLEKFRKFCLIKAGFHDSSTFTCTTEERAHKLAASLQIFIDPENYMLFVVDGNVLHIYRAKSQKKKEMGKQVFERSKNAVLDVAAGIIGVSADDLLSEAPHYMETRSTR